MCTLKGSVTSADENYSASPLNNEAAQLHQHNSEEYYKKVRARHQDLEE